MRSASSSEADFDVVVVGAGAAGLAAAATAAEQGASVIVVEGSDRVGGSSRLAGGMVMGAGSRYQRANGVTDTVEDLYRYYMAINQWRVVPALAYALASESGAAIDWIEGLGVRFSQVVTSGEESVPRGHMPRGEGQAVVDALHGHCRGLGVEFAFAKRIDRLLVHDKKVCGVAAGDDELRAQAVVLATGGFGANRSLVEKLLPQVASSAGWPWYAGAETSLGDAIDLAGQVGADVVGGGRACLLLTPNFGDQLESGYFPGWLVFVNGAGVRFVDETASYSAMQPVAQGQPGPLHAVFDSDALRQADFTSSEASKRVSYGERGHRAAKWVKSMLQEMLEAGVVVSAPTLAELGETIGVPADSLVTTIERYNADLLDGNGDPVYLKRETVSRPLTEPPFFATELRLAHIAVTCAGLRIDQRSRVLGTNGAPISGLLAAGECTGGVIGEVYAGSGNSFVNCLVFGRQSGRTAAMIREHVS